MLLNKEKKKWKKWKVNKLRKRLKTKRKMVMKRKKKLLK